MEEEELIIPVYLNQRIVFDLIAMLQDGMSAVTRITSSEANKTADNQQYGTSFGLSQAFSSLLKIDVSGERAKTKEGAFETQRSEERVHTPSSLFQKLRSILKAKNKIKVPNGSYSPKPGDIIEFSTPLRKNPILQTMDTFVGLVDMAAVFGSSQPKTGSKKQRPNDTSRIKSQLEKFTEGLTSGGTIDIVSDSADWKYKAVITLEEEYLNDPMMSDLVDGQFWVVGKVIRVIDDAGGAVSLLRKASIGSINKEMLEQAFSELAVAAALGNIEIPKIELEIKGPVIQIIPIAIFA